MWHCTEINYIYILTSDTGIKLKWYHLQQPNFSKELTKLAILPDYKPPGLLPRQKSGLILKCVFCKILAGLLLHPPKSDDRYAQLTRGTSKKATL